MIGINEGKIRVAKVEQLTEKQCENCLRQPCLQDKFSL